MVESPIQRTEEPAEVPWPRDLRWCPTLWQDPRTHFVSVTSEYVLEEVVVLFEIS